MVEVKKQHVKIVSIVIALVFVGSVVALALTQSGAGIASAASSSVGVIDAEQVMSQHPKAEEAQKAINQAKEDAQKDFDAKSANMSDQEKQEYFMQTNQRFNQKRQEIVEPLRQSVDEAVKNVASAKGGGY